MEGIGVEEDPQEAIRWYLRAAATGDPICESELGDCHEKGNGVEKDLQRALQLYQSSFDQGLEMVESALERVKAALGVDSQSPRVMVGYLQPYSGSFSACVIDALFPVKLLVSA